MDKRLRMVLALVVVGILVARTAFYSAWSQRFDNVSLLLLAGVVLLLLLPWERLTSLSLGSVAVSLDAPQIHGALSASLDRVADERLRRRLESMTEQLVLMRGARVLWVDDHPNEVLGERRILRSLGVEVMTATSTEEAVEVLRRDGDFDLLITDVQRPGGQSHQKTAGVPLHEGTNMIVALRKGLLDGLAATGVVRKIPVLFYAAYDESRLLEFTRAARELEPEAGAANDLEKLVWKAVQALAESRRNPVAAPTKKVPT
jgi:CheY-like chemotaxis protein